MSLAIAHTFDPDILSSGKVEFTVAAGGRTGKPSLTGRVKFDQVNVAMDGIPNGPVSYTHLPRELRSGADETGVEGAGEGYVCGALDDGAAVCEDGEGVRAAAEAEKEVVGA